MADAPLLLRPLPPPLPPLLLLSSFVAESLLSWSPLESSPPESDDAGAVEEPEPDEPDEPDEPPATRSKERATQRAHCASGAGERSPLEDVSVAKRPAVPASPTSSTSSGWCLE